MKSEESNPPQPNPLPANLDESELASNQNATPVPWIAGTRLVAVQSRSECSTPWFIFSTSWSTPLGTK